MPQQIGVSRVEGHSAHQVIRSLRRSADGFEETGCVKGEFQRSWIEVAGLCAVRYGALDLTGGGKRAARVTMSRGPVGPGRQQLLVGGCRFSVCPTIAEHPGAQIGDFFFLGLQIEGAAGALERDAAASLVEQHLAQLTIDPDSLVVGNIMAPEVNKAYLEVAHNSRADHGLTKFTSVAQLALLSRRWSGGPGFTGRELAARYPGWDRRAGWASPPPSDRRRMCTRTHNCSMR